MAPRRRSDWLYHKRRPFANLLDRAMSNAHQTGTSLPSHRQTEHRERLARGAGGGNERPCSPTRGRRNLDRMFSAVWLCIGPASEITGTAPAPRSTMNTFGAGNASIDTNSTGAAVPWGYSPVIMLVAATERRARQFDRRASVKTLLPRKLRPFRIQKQCPDASAPKDVTDDVKCVGCDDAPSGEVVKFREASEDGGAE